MEVGQVFLVLVGIGLAFFLYTVTGGVGAAVGRAKHRPPPLPTPNARPPVLPVRADEHGLRELENFHANELNAVSISIAELTPDLLQGVSFKRLGRNMADRLAHMDRHAHPDDFILRAAGGIEREYLQTAGENALMGAVFQRTLRDMPDAERATLRLADLLAAAGQISRRERLAIFAPIVWNDGKNLLLTNGPYKAADMLAELRTTLGTLIEGHLGTPTAATEKMQNALRRALAPQSGLTQAERATLERLLYTGARWMTPERAATALVPSQPARPSVLRLGRIEGSEQELLYDRNESLITIAPPGQGKSQSVMRNLLTMDGGAIVIDIKGELFDATAMWRAENVGPVYRFAPADPANSITFNPLDSIRPDVADAYEDAKKLVDLLMVPAEVGKKDYWDRRGLDLLADAILDTALHETGEARSMSSIFDRLFLDSNNPDENGAPRLEGSELDLWLTHLSGTDVRKLQRQAKAIRNMPPKVRESVTDTARTHIDTWQSPRIEQLTMASNFDPLTLRTEKATLYVCVSLDELNEYTSFFRALIGQAFYTLCRGTPDRNAPVVTFFLDEMPKLKRLDILETALDLGRGYGVRLWMFAQNYGQLAEHYKNPDGFLKNALVRQFMGIDGALSLKLSQELSQRHGLIDGKLKPLVEPHELTGEAFRDLTLTVVQGFSPARVVKGYGYAEYADRMKPVPKDAYRGGRLTL